MTTHWTTTYGAARLRQRLDPEFFDFRSESVTEALVRIGSQPLGTYSSAVCRGASPSYDDAGVVRVIKTANVRRFEFGTTPTSFVTQEFASNNPRAIIQSNSIVVTSTGVGSAGRAFANVIEGQDRALLADGHITILPLADRSTAAYICAFLQSPIGVQQLLKYHRGSSRQIELYPQDICSVLIPEVDDGTRASIAQRWLSAVEAVHQSDNAIREAESLIWELLGITDSEVEEPLPAAAAWTTSATTLRVTKRLDAEYQDPKVAAIRRRIREVGGVALSALAIRVRKGFQPAGYTDSGETLVVKAKDVYYPDFSFDTCDRTAETGWPFYIQGGELLINSTGEGTLGRATVVPGTVKDLGTMAIPAVDLLVLDIDRSSVLPEYLAIFLNSRIGRQLSTALQTGSSGQQHLYPAHFELLPIPIKRTDMGDTDWEWQQRIVDLAELRARRRNAADSVAADLDEEFMKIVGVVPDLRTIPE